MTDDRTGALLSSSPELARASRLRTERLPVSEPLDRLLPDGGLRLGSTVAVGGAGATSLALTLVSRASRESWVAVVGMPRLGLVSASELGVDLGHLVHVPDPGPLWLDTMAAAIDAFDVVLTPNLGNFPTPRKLTARVRERRAVLIAIGHWGGSDVRIAGGRSRWHGIGKGHGYLAARTLEITVSGRRGASRPRPVEVWLPDQEGEVRLVEEDAKVVQMAR